CVHCHGLTGDGRGPTGLWIQPHPRDYRQGVFKFVSTEGTGPRKPRRADLLRTLKAGIPGTSMPAFGLLPEEQLERIVDYVVHLSVRGEAEYHMLRVLLSEGEEGLEADIPTDAREWAKRALRGWAEAEGSVIRPERAPPELSDAERMTPGHYESVRRGYELFIDPKGVGCASCHTDFGRGSTFRYDVWGTLVRPRDLTEGVFKGGEGPLDVYRRLRGGIGPSQMPAVTTLSEDQVWDLVHFVRALPYPRFLPPDVREKVYPKEARSLESVSR
ncbi:MAG TPA: cytochrome c, partial [Gemmataceae bacterium]